jgi:pilus assembly protein CpaE
VILLSGREDDALAVGAVRAGAEDYLIKGSVSGESLSRSVRYTLERHARHRRNENKSRLRGRAKARTLAFIGAKGGVGTTTVALNVAAALAHEKRNVILTELRGACGNLSHHFRRIPAANFSRLLDRNQGTITSLELNACLTNYSSALRVLFGPQKADEAKPVPPEIAREVLSTLASMAELVVLDLPAEPSGSNRYAIRDCNFVGLVLEREPSCLAMARIMLDHIRSWSSEALVAAIVVHRAPLAVPMELEQITGALGLAIAGLIPPAADACVLSQKAGIPLVTGYAETLVADSFLTLAATLSEDPIVLRKIA